MCNGLKIDKRARKRINTQLTVAALYLNFLFMVLKNQIANQPNKEQANSIGRIHCWSLVGCSKKGLKPTSYITKATPIINKITEQNYIPAQLAFVREDKILKVVNCRLFFRVKDFILAQNNLLMMIF